MMVFLYRSKERNILPLGLSLGVAGMLLRNT